jgi:hypothetical protein
MKMPCPSNRDCIKGITLTHSSTVLLKEIIWVTAPSLKSLWFIKKPFLMLANGRGSISGKKVTFSPTSYLRDNLFGTTFQVFEHTNRRALVRMRDDLLQNKLFLLVIYIYIGLFLITVK